MAQGQSKIQALGKCPAENSGESISGLLDGIVSWILKNELLGRSLVADLDQHQAWMRGQYGVEPVFGGVVAAPPPEGVWLIHEDVLVEVGEQANAVVGIVVLLIDVGHGYPVAATNVGLEKFSGCGIGRVGMVVIEDESISRPKQMCPDYKQQGQSAGNLEAG